MKVKLRKVGNSYTVTVPKEIVDQLALEEGADLDVDFVAKEDRVTLKPARSRLERLLDRTQAKARKAGVTEADVEAVMREIRGPGYSGKK
ncbi:MAG TPA: AbrB/MazE/SpoVT family DNA-binding domain-containing protein [Coriobacteriia bacterium]